MHTERTGLIDHPMEVRESYQCGRIIILQGKTYHCKRYHRHDGAHDAFEWAHDGFIARW